MQSQYSEYQSLEGNEAILEIVSDSADIDQSTGQTANAIEPVCFHGFFEDYMEMYADAQTVANYLDAHQGWFRRCAHPMQAELIGKNGYALTIGRFGSFGYVVEPKIGLELLPAEEGIYRIRTIAVPNYVAPGYDVDFNATQWLVETTASELDREVQAVIGDHRKVTKVEWQLDLKVTIQFPRFIYRLPMSLIQSTGDRLLAQIVRQVNRRLTYKVQQDFHASLNLPIPEKSRKRAA
ncbi:DUF1997 domain-containing protein [Aerosakkonema funiforme]|uniref:DUF1997 domain-containing protein n=1 Tax=Aerosakkonema funiforme TaxID=1246630 RepID=UPI0035B78CD9